MEDSMENVVKVAVAKVLKSAEVKEASNSLSAGEHYVDATVRVQGVLRKAKDEESAPTVSLSLLETLALTLHYAGCTRESAMEAIRKAVTDALEDGTSTKGEIIEKYDWIDAEIDKIKKSVIAKLPKITKYGKVTTPKLEISEVKMVQEKEQEAETVTA
jgi:hypothetical protein